MQVMDIMEEFCDTVLPVVDQLEQVGRYDMNFLILFLPSKSSMVTSTSKTFCAGRSQTQRNTRFFVRFTLPFFLYFPNFELPHKQFPSLFIFSTNQVYSVIDFGDSQHNPLLYELGIT